MNKKKLTIILCIIVVVLAARFISFNPLTFITALPSFFSFLLTEFLPPNTKLIPSLLPKVMETIYVSIIVSVLASLISLGLAFLVAKKTSPNKSISLALRSFLSLFRNVPMLIWASLLTIVFGIGITAGFMALLVFLIAFLTRVLSDAIDSIDDGMYELMRAVGASRMVLIRNAILPTLMPMFYSWSLFAFEINIRASSILRLVGAGGLGYELKKSMDLFQYQSASAIVLIMIVLMLLVESVSNQIRSRII